jgi:rubrerythrin
MPKFENAFSGLAADRKLTHSELIRAIRFMIASEYEAVQLYMQLAESTDNRLAQEVLKDIADEEVVHAGEFLKLLKELEPAETVLYAEGEAEVIEMMEKIAAGGSGGTISEPHFVTEVEVPGAESPGDKPESSPPSVGSLIRK